MKHKTWFRLVLKAIGVLLVGHSFPMTFFFIAYMISWLSTASTYPMQQWLEIARFGGYLVQLLLGLYLFFGAKWIVNKAIPSNRPYCPECGYDLSKSRGDVCPECGVALPRTAPPIDTP